MKKPNKSRRHRRNNRVGPTPALRESERVLTMRTLCELYPAHQLVRNSYVLSRFWAWFSQIQLNPRLRVPVPRFLTYRDP